MSEEEFKKFIQEIFREMLQHTKRKESLRSLKQEFKELQEHGHDPVDALRIIYQDITGNGLGDIAVDENPADNGRPIIDAQGNGRPKHKYTHFRGKHPIFQYDGE